MTVHSNRSFEVNMLFMSFEINAKCCSITSVVKYDFFIGYQSFSEPNICIFVSFYTCKRTCCIDMSKETKNTTATVESLFFCEMVTILTLLSPQIAALSECWLQTDPMLVLGLLTHFLSFSC